MTVKDASSPARADARPKQPSVPRELVLTALIMATAVIIALTRIGQALGLF